MGGGTDQPTDDKDRSGLDSTGEFFSVGTPLHAVRAGYVRRKADDILFEAVAAGGYAHVLAPEHSGKSSLIAATAARLETHGIKIAILDLAQIGLREGSNDPGRWYYNVAYRLLRQLRIRYDLQSWWHDRSMLSNRQRLLEFYSEIVLEHVQERVVVFIDEIQCIESMPFADQLLASIRAAHNTRTTDPDFSRLSFVLLGECDPVSLIAEPELSPFNVTQQVLLEDFTREQLDLFATELNLDGEAAAVALDRIYYWTRGQPYLCQKIARAVARGDSVHDVAEFVDGIAIGQLAGRAALHNEPHMSHIHRAIVGDEKRKEALLNLYGKIRKGIEVAADLGSPLQRRLMAVGLVVIDHDGNLRVRNRLYAAVFTARWANENLPTRLRVPAMVVGVIALFVLVPFWYTQWLPGPYLDLLTSPTIELSTARSAYENLRSFPGHADTADDFLRSFVEQRAALASTPQDIEEIALLAAELPDVGQLPDRLRAQYWDREAVAAMLEERRDAALLATLQSLIQPTQRRRQRLAGLVADDYPMLLATLPSLADGRTVFDPTAMIVTSAEGAQISQWSYATQLLQQRDSWSVTALEVVPLVRRVIVDREGSVNRVGLTLNLSHARVADLRIKIIAPSGRTVEVHTDLERVSSNDDIRIPAAQLQDFIGESLNGTWSISVRDESLGVAGQLVGWNLKLNSQGAVEDFQRGLNIPDPTERETDNVWFDRGGRYAVARATQSDSARIWDLAFGEPIRAIPVNENESLIGLDAGARRLVTATQDSINLWDTASGDRVAILPVGAASSSAVLSDDGLHVFVAIRGDIETRLELWSLESGKLVSELAVAGVPALVEIDPTGSRVAVADYDRAVRVWDFVSGAQLAQIDLPIQASTIHLSAGGDALGVVHGQAGVSLWSVARPQNPMLQEFGAGAWQLIFSPSGASALAGRPSVGFQLYSSRDGRLVGPAIGVQSHAGVSPILAFSSDEKTILTGEPASALRFWRATDMPSEPVEANALDAHPLWRPSADRVMAALPGAGGIAIGDPTGHVHILPAGASLADVQAASEDVSFLGHMADVRLLSVARSGDILASAASDNTIRIWETASGKPLSYTAHIPGDEIRQMVFAPGGGLLAVLKSQQLALLSIADGSLVAQFELGEPHGTIAFAADERLYAGGESGALRVVTRDADGAWSMQQQWTGPAAIRRIESSPRGDHLVVVDANNQASLFMLAAGQVGEATLQFPGGVEDVVFNRNGTRALFRTARWVHRVSASSSGLLWIDSALSPKPLQGARIVFASPGSGQALRPYLPAARNGFVELVELAFPGSSTAAMFGNKDELLAEWQPRLLGPRALAVAD